jgi:hypothetical protein
MRCAAATIPGLRALPRGRDGTTRVAGAALAAALALIVPPAAAGPWGRDAGEFFLSFTLTGEETRAALSTGRLEPETTVSAYGEFGLGNRLTAGIDLNWGEVSQMAVVFARRTFTPPDAAWQVALDAGAGMRAVDGQPTQTLLRFGASVGRGFGGWQGRLGRIAAGHDGGWMTLDASALVDPEGDDVIWQTEATLGVNLGTRWRGILALKAEEWPGADPVLTARPSLVFELGEGTALQAGMHAGLAGSDAVGASLALWREF